jgi:hypothetical protein
LAWFSGTKTKPRIKNPGGFPLDSINIDTEKTNGFPLKIVYRVLWGAHPQKVVSFAIVPPVFAYFSQI